MLYKKHFIQFVASCLLLNNLHAQVPVIKEPHHKPVLVNNYVRLLDVHINQNDTTQYHIHAAPSIIVIISNSTIGSQKFGEAPSATNNVTAGSTSFIDYGTNPVTHRVFNEGNNVFHVMDIELVKKNPSPDSCAALQQSNVQTTLNEQLVRTYKFDIAAHQSFNIPKTNCAHLLVCISGEANAQGKTINIGGYAFFKPNTNITISNSKNENANFVLLELK